MNYSEFKDLAASEKITLAWVEPSQRKITGWVEQPNNVFKTQVEYFVTGIHVDGIALSQATSDVLAAGSWFFDPIEKSLFVRRADIGSPAKVWTEVTYRLFFSDAPVNLPWDLSDGVDVSYLPILKSGSRGDLPPGFMPGRTSRTC